MIVTTALRTNSSLILEAKSISEELKLPYIERGERTIPRLMSLYESDILVVSKQRLSIHMIGYEKPLFFHPNSAMFRVKRILRGEEDPFLVATKLTEGMKFLDCTLGLASDSIVASAVVGKSGQVVGIEGNSYMAYVVKQGLISWESGLSEMDEAMKRINVHVNDHYHFLRELESNMFDVVYFDPMFEQTIHTSDGIDPIRNIALYTPITAEIIAEALRVAKKRVVLKDYWKSSRFEQFGFNVYKRPTAQFHYATIELNKE